jgi:hypothetical protein
MQCVLSDIMNNYKEERKLISLVNSLEDRHLLEVIAVKKGLKDIFRVHISNNSEYEILKHYCSLNKLHVNHSNFRLKLSWMNDIGDQFFEDIPWDDESDDAFVAYVTKNKIDKLDRAVSIELEESHIEAGLIYEYPLCCCQNYEAIAKGSKWLELMLKNSIGTYFEPNANKLSYLVHGYSLFPDYFPCSFHCEGTMDLSTKYFQIGLEANLEEYVKMQYSMMNSPYLVIDESVFAFSRWSIRKDNILCLSLNSMSCYGKNYLSDFPENTIIIKLPKDNINSFWTWNNRNFRVLLFSHEYSTKY